MLTVKAGIQRTTLFSGEGRLGGRKRGVEGWGVGVRDEGRKRWVRGGRKRGVEGWGVGVRDEGRKRWVRGGSEERGEGLAWQMERMG